MLHGASTAHGGLAPRKVFFSVNSPPRSGFSRYHTNLGGGEGFFGSKEKKTEREKRENFSAVQIKTHSISFHFVCFFFPKRVGDFPIVFLGLKIQRIILRLRRRR